MGLKKWLITGCEVSGYSLLYVETAQRAIAKAEAARIDKPVITTLPGVLLYLSCSAVSLIFNLLEEKNVIPNVIPGGQGEYLTERFGFGSIMISGISRP